MQPSILVIWGGDIGTENISYYNRRTMGYQTPNPTLTASPVKAFSSLTITASNLAPPDALRSSTALNGIVSHEDWLPTFAAAGGNGEIKE